MKTETAIKHFGSATGLAKALEITPGAVSQWGDQVPQLRSLQIEKITNGELSSDIFSDQPGVAK